MLKNPSSFSFVLYLEYTFVTFFRSFRLRFYYFYFSERWKIVPEMGTIAKSNRIFRGRTLGTSGKNKLHRMIHEFLEWVSFFIFCRPSYIFNIFITARTSAQRKWANLFYCLFTCMKNYIWVNVILVLSRSLNYLQSTNGWPLKISLVYSV